MNSRFGNPRTLIATATYNERDNIDPLLQSIFELDGEFEALVIDDASPDGTGAHLEHLAGTEARLHVVRRPSKLGLGSAHQLAFMYAIHRGYDRLVTMDADLSHDPDDIPRLLDELDGEFEALVATTPRPMEPAPIWNILPAPNTSCVDLPSWDWDQPISWLLCMPFTGATTAW